MPYPSDIPDIANVFIDLNLSNLIAPSRSFSAPIGVKTLINVTAFDHIEQLGLPNDIATITQAILITNPALLGF